MDEQNQMAGGQTPQTDAKPTEMTEEEKKKQAEGKEQPPIEAPASDVSQEQQ